MRTLISLSSIPAAIITFIISNILFAIAGTIFNGLATYNDSMHSFGMLDVILTWVTIYVGQSIVPVLAANFVMFIILDGEQTYWLSIFPKVLFATLGVILFSSAIVFRVVTGIELESYLAAHILSIVSFIAVPIYLGIYK
jgi:hypothetical protein